MNNSNKRYEILSFVRRDSRMSSNRKQALSELWPQYGVELESSPLNLTNIFNRKAPTIVEIGFGMGDSLIAMAKAELNKNFLGIDVHLPGIASLLLAIKRENLHNIRICQCNCIEVFRKYIVDNSVSGIQIYFPDPWPKRRHHKRRLIQHDFVALLKEKLQIGGYLHLATDWQDYAEQMLSILNGTSGFKNMAEDGRFSKRPSWRPLTKFELRGMKAGHKIWDLIFKKVQPSKL